MSMFIEENTDDTFPLTVTFPRWAPHDVYQVFLSAVRGVVLGHEVLPPELKDLIEWVGLGRGTREWNQWMREIDIEVKLRLESEKYTLPILRLKDPKKGYEYELRELFVAHVRNGVHLWADEHQKARKAILDRVKAT